MTPLISVIIVNYNAGPRLQKTIDHLKAQTFQDFEVIVIDNGSQDGSADNLDTQALDFSLIKARENLGFAAGNNKAAPSAKGKWLALLNPDAYAAPDWLAGFIEGMHRYPDAEAFGSLQIDASEPSRLDGAGDVYHIAGLAYRGYFGWPVASAPKEGEIFAPCAAAAFYRADSFRSLGGFDERFFCYGEDVDLGYRLRLRGGEAIYLPDAIVHHEGSAISGRHSDFTMYHGHRNRIWLTYKNTPFWLYWPFLPLHFVANLYLVFRFLVAGTLRPYVKALIHGYGGLSKFRADRKSIQSQRTASYKALIRLMAFSPLSIFSRKGKVKSKRPDKQGTDMGG